MSQSLAFANAFSLAATLMVCVTVFRTGAGDFGVIPSNENEGDVEVIAEIDPFER
jgi:hypothetical protein